MNTKIYNNGPLGFALPRNVENIFIGIERFLDVLQYAEQHNTGFPPHNLEQIDDENFVISLAVAGYDKSEISITLEKDEKPNVLVVSGFKKNHEKKNFIHQGIAGRKFSRRFPLLEELNVKNCEMKNGMLNIYIEMVVPEEKKPVSFEIK